MTHGGSFRGYLLPAPTLVAAARLGGVGPDSLPENYDLGDLLTDAMRPTADLIAVRMNADGTASFALHRQESGQGVTTMAAMLIAEELDLPLERVDVTLADARPELLFNQFTAGSSTVRTVYTPIRVAAALVRTRLLSVAADRFGVDAHTLTARRGVITAPDGRSVGYGDLAGAAASVRTESVDVELKPTAEFTVIGRPQNRIDALDAVTGRKTYAMDLHVPGALPTMVCRPPTIRGTLRALHNAEKVLAMPGVTHVLAVSTGVAVRAETFGQCVDAIDAVDADWGPGTVDTATDDTVLADLRAAEIDFEDDPTLPPHETLDGDFVFHFRTNTPLEPQTCIADVRDGRATLWAPLQSPVLTQRHVAELLDLPVESVDVHVQQAGGAFGRRVFSDAALEAAEISAAIGEPVRLMWQHGDEYRHGRTHPMCTSRIRVSHDGDEVLAFEQLHTGVTTDYTQGFGEVVTGVSTELAHLGLPSGGLSAPVFELTVNVPYRFGLATQDLQEIYEHDTFPTGGARNQFNSEVVTARELMVDRLAERFGRSPFSFRKEYLSDDRLVAVLNKAAVVGRWGRPMEPGTAQAICVHKEFRGANATLVEIDCRGAEPRVSKVVAAVDTGLTINPRGLEAQIQGGISDGIAQALTAGLHLRAGTFAEADWDDYRYTRMWTTPPEIEVVVMPPTTGRPGGAGEFGVAAAMAATACAYARATGTLPTVFPLSH